ncbi:MAG: hypothetical protein RIS76_989 [Verrucomicrobiota bacterium]
MAREYTPRPRHPVRRRRARWPWVVLLLLVLAGGGGWYWFQGRQLDVFGPGQAPVSPPPDRRVPPSISEQPRVVPKAPIRVEPVPVPPPLPQTPPPVVTPSPAPVLPRGPTNKVASGPRVALDPTPFAPRLATNMLEAQIALEQLGLGSGSVDGVGGEQTASALRAFQYQHGLEETGRRDRDTERALMLTRAPLRRFVVREEHLARLHKVPATWLEKSELPRLDYESLLELVGESTHAHPSLLRRLNPGLEWNAVRAGTELIVPDAEYPAPKRASLVRISLAGRYLRAYDERGTLLAHFPVSIGRVAEKRPVGALSVVVSVKDPNYTFDPAVFPESAEGRKLGRKLLIPPGPNNPVGMAWIGLSRPGYGIHGTPGPEQVGRTESHGCFRLANWNAEQLRRMISVGTPVRVER